MEIRQGGHGSRAGDDLGWCLKSVHCFTAFSMGSMPQSLKIMCGKREMIVYTPTGLVESYELRVKSYGIC
jgi:hypothetical protein